MPRSQKFLSQLGEKPSRRIDKAELQQTIRSAREAVLIVNARARRGGQLYAQARRLLEQRGLRITEAYPVRDPGRIPELITATLAKNPPLVIVGGGDGTVSSVVDFFANRDVALGVLPLGTANSFCRSVGIPVEVEGAVDVIAAGKIADVDLGSIDGDLFANSASLGMSPQIARTQPHLLKRYLGRAGYVIAAAGVVARYQPFACRIVEDDGNVVTIPGALDVLIANGTYHGGVPIADEADVESRDLVIRVMRGKSRLDLMRLWGRLWMRRPLKDANLTVIRTTAARLETDPPQYISIDGEVVTQTPVTVRVARQALHLMVPESFVDR